MDTHDDRGWVKPVDTGGDTAMMDPIEPTGRTLGSSVVGGIVLVAIIVAAVAGTVMWRNRNGDPFAAARSVPADMDIVITFDALALSDSERLQSFVDAFAVPMVDAGFIDEYPDDLVEAIDDAMREEGDITLSDDVFSWIGRSVSFAMVIPEIDMATAEVDEMSMLVSADVRDRAAAEAFIDKVIDEMVGEGVEVGAASIGGQPGYTWAPEYEDVAFGLVLTDDTLLVGIEEAVVSAIEASDAGLSIAEDAVFQDTMDRLPGDNMVSVYVAPSAYERLIETASAGMEVDEADLEVPFGSLGIAAGLVDEGVRINYVMTGTQDAAAQFTPDLRVLAGLPDDTLGFISLSAEGTLDDATLSESVDDLGYALEEIGGQFGVDLVELLDSLSGSMTIAAAETRRSSIADATDVPVGVVGALGVTDTGPVNDLIDAMEEMLGDQGAEFDRDGDVTSVVADGQELVSYSIGDDLFVIGSGPDLVADVRAGEGGGLLDSALYQELDGAVIGEGLVFYVDIAGIVDLVPMTSDEAAVFSPVRGAGWGGRVAGDMFELELLILVDY